MLGAERGFQGTRWLQGRREGSQTLSAGRLERQARLLRRLTERSSEKDGAWDLDAEGHVSLREVLLKGCNGSNRWNRVDGGQRGGKTLQVA